MPIRVLIVDDHPALRRGLRSLLSTHQDIEVIGEAGDGAAALLIAHREEPDVVLLDVRLPGSDGVEVAQLISQQVPHSKIIILTAFENDEYVVGTLSSGVYAYLLKNTSDETVVQTVRRVYQGERLLTPSLMDKVLRQFETLAKSHAHREHDLGDDELAVLALIAEGASIQEIGAKVYCSERTVKRRIEGIVTKLGVRNRSQAVAHAIKSGLIQPIARTASINVRARRPIKEEQEETLYTPVRDQGFGRAVVSAYDHRCAFCGIRMFTSDGYTAVEAAHIIPWAFAHNDDPRNGLALCRLCQWAFDEGLLGVTVRYTRLAAARLRLAPLQDHTIFLPAEEPLHPDPAPLAWHRSKGMG